ncbi:hypothetical protein JNW88_31730, partial [Micromonospora sp. ATA32]|nr:hypothetical protein [Micromonospora sp. ATA32]
MGYKLRREMRDALPPGLLTAAERLLVLELADQCNDTTREGWPGAEVLAELTDLSPRSIQEALNRIGKKWTELRVPLGKDAKGRPYYSYAGKRTTFRFPPMPRREGAMNPGASDGATDAGASGPEGATDLGGRCDESVPKVRQIRAEGATDPGAFSSKNHSEDQPLISLPAAADDAPSAGHPVDDRERDEDSPKPEPQDLPRRLVAARGVAADMVDQVVTYLVRTFNIDGPGWWITADRNGTLDQRIAEALKVVSEPTPDEPQPAAEPPQCGSCDPNRFVWVRGASGRVALSPCPTCHRRGKSLSPGAVIVNESEARADSTPK